MKWIATLVLTTAVVLLPRGAAKAESNNPQPPQPIAQPPATQPAPPQHGLPPPEGFNGGMRSGFGPRFLLPFDQLTPTEEQIKAAEAFVKENSPNHYAAYEHMDKSGEVGQFRNRLQTVMVRGYLDLQVLDANQHDLYLLKLDQIKVQDDIFGAIFRYRHMGKLKDNEKVRSELREELKPLEEKLLKSRKKESEQRLKSIKVAAEREQHNLERLQAMGPNDIDNLVNQEIESGGRMSSFGPFRHRDREHDH